jgi:hypothetical protein
MKLEDCELREYTHGFFANVAECLGSDFKKYLPLAVPMAAASCLSNEGLVFYKVSPSSHHISSTSAVAMRAHITNHLQETNDDIAGITEDSEFAQTNVGAPEAYFDEKSSATRALGEFAKHTGPDFMPYLPKALEVLVEMAKFGFTDVRKNALGSLTGTSDLPVRVFDRRGSYLTSRMASSDLQSLWKPHIRHSLRHNLSRWACPRRSSLPFPSRHATCSRLPSRF